MATSQEGTGSLCITEEWIRDRLNLHIDALGMRLTVFGVLHARVYVCVDNEAEGVLLLSRWCEIAVFARLLRGEDHSLGEISVVLHPAQAP